jgi:hypothetical protein
VKWFNATKGFGFIQTDSGGKDVFAHISAVEKAGLQWWRNQRDRKFQPGKMSTRLLGLYPDARGQKARTAPPSHSTLPLNSRPPRGYSTLFLDLVFVAAIGVPAVSHASLSAFSRSRLVENAFCAISYSIIAFLASTWRNAFCASRSALVIGLGGSNLPGRLCHFFLQPDFDHPADSFRKPFVLVFRLAHLFGIFVRINRTRQSRGFFNVFGGPVVPGLRRLQKFVLFS